MKSKRVVAIIQTRMGSTRLPGKVMMSILGKPMLWHIVNRAKKAKLIDQVVVATSMSQDDKKIVDFCKKNNIEVFEGPLNDVLKRYYLAAEKYKADIIVRITADCPVVDPEIIDKTIRFYKRGKYDLVGVAAGAGVIRGKIKKFPDGLDCTVFSMESLKIADNKATGKDDREHVTLYIVKRPKEFKLGTLKSSRDYSNIRLTVDYKEDLELIRKIYRELYSKDKIFNLSDIISLIKSRPELLKINQKYIGREGYGKLWQKES